MKIKSVVCAVLFGAVSLLADDSNTLKLQGSSLLGWSTSTSLCEQLIISSYYGPEPGVVTVPKCSVEQGLIKKIVVDGQVVYLNPKYYATITIKSGSTEIGSASTGKPEPGPVKSSWCWRQPAPENYCEPLTTFYSVDRVIELGFRSDGVVTWREKK